MALVTTGIVEVIGKSEKYEGRVINGGNIKKMDLVFPSWLLRELFIQDLNEELFEGICSNGVDKARVYLMN